MGIPKFYRWLSERYPLLNQKFTATEVAAEIDNLYLDMNGIIHNCTHANQKEVKMTEDDMMLKIFDYIDKLVQVIRPKKLLFMAIDGVAPRAKMNQQRSRRFKAAKERIEIENEKRKKGEEISADPFDSNCITPGTPFMERLGKHLRFFIRRKMSEDLLWQTPAVVFSGHDVPGEGEHKIMEYLRWEKRSPNYQPNQRHCLYGLDADLIMLSLVTHEPHFCLLREIVSYTGGNRGQPARETLDNPCAENFILFHIGILREYLEVEFKSVAVPFEPSGQVNVERVVDDFVLFCMLIGNDFLPALPTLDINEGALNHIMTIYKKLLGHMGGYLTLAGDLDRRRLELLLKELGALEQEVLEERAKDAEYMEGKKAKRAAQNDDAWAPFSRNGNGNGNGNSRSATTFSARSASPAAAPTAHGPGGARQAAGPSANGKGFGGPMARKAGGNGLAVPVSALEEATGMIVDTGDDATETSTSETEATEAAAPSTPPLAKFLEVIGAVSAVALEDGDEAVPVVAAEPTMMSKEARQMMLSGQGERGLQMWKDRWYNEKLTAQTPAERRRVVEFYLQGLHWVLEYYYRGVASWDWYYPYYFAPMASDLVDLPSITVQFTQGKPFRPYEQLLSVLPAASAKLLPPAFQPLMLSSNSPILDFYPADFECDMEGKRAAWEGVVKVPFVDEARLLKAVASIPEGNITPAEHARNKLGEILVFTNHTGSTETEYCTSTMPEHFRDISAPKSRLLRTAMPPPLPVGERGFTPTLVPGTLTGLGAPRGYPTLKSIQVRANIRNAGVNVLGTPSRKESVLLVLPDLPEGGKASAKQASILLGNRCYINWPYLQEAVIVRVSDANEQWYQTGHSQPQCKKWQSQEASKWQAEANEMASILLTTRGLEIGRVDLVLHIKVCRGFIRHLDGTVQRQYSQDEVTFPLQCVLRSRPGASASTGAAAATAAPTEDEDAQKLPELKEGDRAIFLGKGHYGAVCTILPDLGVGMTKGGKVLKTPGASPAYHVSVQPLGPGGADPGARAARQAAALGQTRYFPSHEVARKLRIHPRVLGRITASVWVQDGDDRYDLGLAVRLHNKGLCVPGFATPTPDGNSWQYSQAMMQVLSGYQQAHPWLWDALAAQAQAPDGERGSMRLSELLPGLNPDERKAKAAAASSWVKSSPLAVKPLVKANVLMMADEGIRALQLALPPPVVSPVEEFENVPPALLLPGFEPGPEQVKLAIQGGNFSLGDRVVCLLKAGIPQFGLRGTVIGIFDEALEVLFDVDFPGGTNLGGKIRGRCGAQVPKDIMLNITNPVTMPLNKSAIPRPASATITPPAARRSASAATAVGAAALARQAAVAATDNVVTAQHTATTPPAVAAARTSSMPASAAQPRPASGVPSHVTPAGPAPPPPSSSMINIAKAGSGQLASNAMRAPKTLVSKSADPPAAPPENVGMQLLKRLQTNSAPPAAPAPAPAAIPAPPINVGLQLLKHLQSGKTAAAAPQHAPVPLTEAQVASAHAHVNAALATHHAPPHSGPPPPGSIGLAPPHHHHHHHHMPAAGHAPYMIHPHHHPHHGPPHPHPHPPPPGGFPPMMHQMGPPPPMPPPYPGMPPPPPPHFMQHPHPRPHAPPHRAPVMLHAPPPPPPRPAQVNSPTSPQQPPAVKAPAKPTLLVPSHVVTTTPKSTTPKADEEASAAKQ